MQNISLYERIPSIDNNFTVKFRVYKSGHALVPHWHEHIEMLYFCKGSCDFICNGKSFLVSAGDLVVVNSTEIHSFEVRGEVEFFSVLMYPEFFSDVNMGDYPLKNLVRGDEYVSECMLTAERDYTEGGIGADMLLKSHIYRLIAYLTRNYVYTEGHRTDDKTRASMLTRLGTVMEYITKYYADKITTSMLADMCYLSEAHFCRFFKAAVGMTVTEYVNGYRIKKASVLLLSTDESIARIAAAVGFDDINYFSRVFKRIMGTSPGKYRAQATA